jgi:hypothetical protein
MLLSKAGAAQHRQQIAGFHPVNLIRWKARCIGDGEPIHKERAPKPSQTSKQSFALIPSVPILKRFALIPSALHYRSIAGQQV